MEPDPLLRRVERTAVVACLAMAGVALALAKGRAGPALGVLGGGLLIAVSYRTIGAGVTGLVGALAPQSVDATTVRSRPRLAWTVVKVGSRYALLALLAYVMIARLRLHPLGLMAGASSVVAAVSVEAIRLLKTKSN